MSLSSSTSRNDYVGNAAVSSYDYDFKIFHRDDLTVTVADTAGVETTLAITTDYTVSGVGDTAGGSIQLVNNSQSWLTGGNLKSGYALTIRRIVDLVQETDIRNQGAFFPEAHEDAFDYMTMIDQQQQDEIDRSIKFSETDTASTTTLPADRANKFLAFDADGEMIASNGGISDSIPVSAFMETVLDDTTALAARNTLGITDQLYTFRSHGAVGDGLTDDTTAIQAALDSGVNLLDGEGLTYLISAELTGPSNIHIRNAKFSLSTLATNGAVLSFTGTEGTATLLTANATAGAFSVSVTSASGFVEDGWAFIRSDADFSTTDGVDFGEMVRIESISGTTLNLYSSILLTYNTAANAEIAPLTTKSNIILENLSSSGIVSTGNQRFLEFTICDNVQVNNCHSSNFDHTHIYFDKCANYAVRGGSANKTGVQEGLDYGIAHVNGCFNGLVDGYTASLCRHLSTIGGSDGICRFIRVINCMGYNLTDAGIDAHAAVHEHDFSHNFLSFSNDADVTKEGIVSLGGQPTIIGNTIVAAGRHGVFWQPVIETAFPGILSATISNNKFESTSNTSAVSAVLAQTTAGSTYANIKGITITGNTAQGFDNMVFVNAKSGGEIYNVNISHNTCLDAQATRGIRIYSEGAIIQNVIINGNIIDVGTNECIYLQGTVTYPISYVNIANNKTKDGTYGLRILYCQYLNSSGNLYESASSANFLAANSDYYKLYDIASIDDIDAITNSVTISTGEVTVKRNTRFLKIDTEAAAASDDLTTISGGYEGQEIVISTVASARDVVCKNSGNLRITNGADITLGSVLDTLTLYYDGSNWIQIGYADNTA